MVFKLKQLTLYETVKTSTLCPQQSDLGIGGGRFTTAMLYLSDVEVGPLHVLTINLKQQNTIGDGGSAAL